MFYQRPGSWASLLVLGSPGGDGRGHLNTPGSAQEGMDLLGCAGAAAQASGGDPVVLSWGSAPPQAQRDPQVAAGAPAPVPQACSAPSLPFTQYGHSNKTIANVTLSSGNPGSGLLQQGTEGELSC